MKHFLTRSRFLIISLLIILGMPHGAWAAEDWQVDHFASEIRIQPDGVVEVREQIDVFFHEEKHGIYRDIPYVYERDGTRMGSEIDVTRVEIDGHAADYSIERNAVNLRIKIGDPDQTIRGRHQYHITYTAVGVLRSFGSYDEFYWNATGNDWDVPISLAEAEVILPEPGIEQVACYQGAIGSQDSCATDRVSDTRIRFSSTALPPNEGLTVAVGYTAGMVPVRSVAPPFTFLEAALSPLSIGLFSGMSLLVVMYLGRVWYIHGRDRWYGHQLLAEGEERYVPFGTRITIAPEFAPPDNLRPAEIGVLMDERADTLDVTATIVDLAVRGYLTITELEKKWRFSDRDYQLKQTDKSAEDLQAYERKLYNHLFNTGKEVKLSQLKNKFYRNLRHVKAELYKLVGDKGYFVKRPDAVRVDYQIWGIVCWVFGLICLFFAASTPMPVLTGAAFGLMLSAAFILLASLIMPARSAKGRHLYHRALGYKLFITKAEKYRAQFAERENMFTEVLPYAIIFGATKQLAKAMEQIGSVPQAPAWYHGIHPFNPVVFASDIDGLSKTLSTAIASSPGGSGSGGGGMSGGGFGGGGGGSW